MAQLKIFLCIGGDVLFVTTYDASFYEIKANLCTNKLDLKAETLHEDPYQGELPTVEIEVT